MYSVWEVTGISIIDHSTRQDELCAKQMYIQEPLILPEDIRKM